MDHIWALPLTPWLTASGLVTASFIAMYITKRIILVRVGKIKHIEGRHIGDLVLLSQ